MFVDSPIGVGFSYSDDPRDRVFNESVTAADLLDFLEEFLHGAQGFGSQPLLHEPCSAASCTFMADDSSLLESRPC